MSSLIQWVLSLSKDSISPSESHLLLVLAYRCGKKNECWPSLASLIQDTKFSRRRVIELRQSLIEKGFISYTGIKAGKQKQIPIMRLNSQELNDFTGALHVPGKTFTSALHVPGTSALHVPGTSALHVPGNYKEEITTTNDACAALPRVVGSNFFSSFFKDKLLGKKLMMIKNGWISVDSEYRDDEGFLKVCEWHVKQRMLKNEISLESATDDLCGLMGKVKYDFGRYEEARSLEKKKEKDKLRGERQEVLNEIHSLKKMVFRSTDAKCIASLQIQIDNLSKRIELH